MYVRVCGGEHAREGVKEWSGPSPRITTNVFISQKSRLLLHIRMKDWAVGWRRNHFIPFGVATARATVDPRPQQLLYLRLVGHLTTAVNTVNTDFKSDCFVCRGELRDCGVPKV